MRRSWTSVEIQFLKANKQQGAEAVASALGRSIWSVKKAAQRHGITLRTARYPRRGLVLGQPRDISLAGSEIRADLVEGVVDPEVVLARLELEAKGAAICPACGRREVATREGFCVPCHNKALARAHRTAIQEVTTRRDVWATRQALHRARTAETPAGEARA